LFSGFEKSIHEINKFHSESNSVSRFGLLEEINHGLIHGILNAFLPFIFSVLSSVLYFSLYVVWNSANVHAHSSDFIFCEILSNQTDINGSGKNHDKNATHNHVEEKFTHSAFLYNLF
jgi:hypothetical protein